MLRMGATEATRNQSLYGLAKNLVPNVAEQGFRLGIDQNDLALTVDDDHRVGG